MALHNEHVFYADRIYEIRHNSEGEAIHVFIKNGYANIYPSLEYFLEGEIYMTEVEHICVEEKSLSQLYECPHYDYKNVKKYAESLQLT